MDNKLKLYYSIGEISNILGIKPSKIRFWEKEFEILNPQKNNKGNRRYTFKDLKKLNSYIIYSKKKNILLLVQKKINNNFEEIEKNLELIQRLKK